MNLLNQALLFSGQATSDAPVPNTGAMVMQLMFIPLMIAAFYFLLIRPQKKKQKQDKAMRETLQVADEVVTVGGIIGRVLSVKDDTVLIETGGDRTRIRVLRSSIAENRTIHDN